MAQQLPNQFTEYQLTESETLSGTILTPLQRFVLQNRLAEISKQRLTLEFNPVNSAQFIQDEAFLKGQISIITWQLEASAAAELEALENSSSM